jgi:pyridoxamine 5'-phosphate oxidase
MSIANMRISYTYGELLEEHADTDPFRQFASWFEQATAANLPEPNAMTLATVGADGRPAARVVLLKGVDHGFVFFTNYESRKGNDLSVHPYAALVFYWYEQHRQVRIEGCVEQVSAAESDEYYNSRPAGSRLGAWASAQSRVIASRTVLEQRIAELEAQYADQEAIPRPPYWGGFRVIPDQIEFWQGRPSRLHDRLRYRLVDGVWVRERLSP